MQVHIIKYIIYSCVYAQLPHTKPELSANHLYTEHIVIHTCNCYNNAYSLQPQAHS